MISIDVAVMEFVEGGNTVWIHSQDGTVLRIKCTGKIEVGRDCTNNVAHADLMVAGNIHVCMPPERRKRS